MQDDQTCMFCETSNLKPSRFRRPIKWETHIFNFLICKKCRGYSLYPKLTDSQLKLLYSADYSDHNASPKSSYQDYLTNHGYRYSMDYLELNLNSLSQICDFGCGLDRTISKLAAKIGAKYIEIEYDESTVSNLAKSCAKNTYMTTSQFERSEEKFDYIFIGDVLEHVGSPSELLRLVSKKIKAGGKIVIQGPLENANTVLHWLVKLKSLAVNKRVVFQHPYHVSLASKTSMLRLFQQNNFEVLQLKTYEVPWPVIMDVNKRSATRWNPICIAKYLDLKINRFLPSTGNRFLAVLKLRNLND